VDEKTSTLNIGLEQYLNRASEPQSLKQVNEETSTLNIGLEQYLNRAVPQ
jgi:hypothetical protein